MNVSVAKQKMLNTTFL